MSVRVEFLEQRFARLEHEHKSAPRVHERHAAVQREVNLAVVFMAGRTKLAERADRAAIERIFGDERAGLWLRHQNRMAGVLERSDPAQHRSFVYDPRTRAARQHEAADAESDW